MTQTTGRGANSMNRHPSSQRLAGQRPAGQSPAARRATTVRQHRAALGARLGQWNSAVTSYYLLTGATAILVVLGLVMVLSSSSVESLADDRSPYAEFAKQARFALIGLPGLWLASRLPMRFYKKASWPLLGAAALLQLMVIFFGIEVNGNRAWLEVGPIRVQPAEAVKIALALWLGAVLARKQPLMHEWKHAVIPVLPVAGIMIALVMAGDLGTALVLIVLVAGAMFLGGVPLRIFGVAGLFAAAGVAMLTTTSSNRVGRITCWFTNTCDPTDGGYQTLHGTWGLATGGWWGLGLGQSREKWSYLPEAQNDFIFAIIGEELGLVGTLLVLVLFALLAIAMSRVITRHTDPFVKITTAAIAFWVIGQALLNIGVVIGLAPVIGVPLPLVSAGGSALIMTMVALGVVISFARAEPGAAEALAARPGVVRRSLAVIGRPRRRSGRP